MSFKNCSPIVVRSVLLWKGVGMKLEACQSFSVNPLPFFRKRIVCDFWSETLKLLSNLLSLPHCKKKARKLFCYFIKPAWFIYWKCTICHLCLATLLFYQEECWFNTKSSVCRNLIALVLSVDPVNFWHWFTQHNAVHIYITDVFI